MTSAHCASPIIRSPEPQQTRGFRPLGNSRTLDGRSACRFTRMRDVGGRTHDLLRGNCAGQFLDHPQILIPFISPRPK